MTEEEIKKVFVQHLQDSVDMYERGELDNIILLQVMKNANGFESGAVITRDESGGQDTGRYLKEVSQNILANCKRKH